MTFNDIPVSFYLEVKGRVILLLNHTRKVLTLCEEIEFRKENGL